MGIMKNIDGKFTSNCKPSILTCTNKTVNVYINNKEDYKLINIATGKLEIPKLERKSTSLLETIEEEEKEDYEFEKNCQQTLNNCIISANEKYTTKLSPSSPCSSHSSSAGDINSSNFIRNNDDSDFYTIGSNGSRSLYDNSDENDDDISKVDIKHHSIEIYLTPEEEEEKMKNKHSEHINKLLKVIGKSLEGIASASQIRRTHMDDPFEGLKVPGICISNYLKRLIRYLEAWKPVLADQISISERCIVMSMLLIDKLCTKNKDFQLSVFNIHRILLVTFLLAVKYTEDIPFPNSFWARVGGVPLDSLNRMEISFLKMCDFNVHIPPSHFEITLKRFTSISFLKK